MTDTHSVTNAGMPDNSRPETAGSMLRSAREAAGLHVAALAVAMKVPVKKLEALEADRLDLLPDAVFVRALASSVCRNLKIDSAAVLALLPHHDVPRLGDAQRSINTPFHRSGEGRVWSFPVSLKQPALVLTVLLVLAAVALWTLPGWHTASIQQMEPLIDDVTPVAGTPPAEPFVVPSADAVTLNPTAVASPAPVASEPIVSPVIAAVSAADTDVAPKAKGDSVLTLSARGPSWVEVMDAKGQVLVRRNLAAGESVGPMGSLPLSVVVGRVDMTDVLVRGKAMDLAGMSRDNVARFEVK